MTLTHHKNLPEKTQSFQNNLLFVPDNSWRCNACLPAFVGNQEPNFDWVSVNKLRCISQGPTHPLLLFVIFHFPDSTEPLSTPFLIPSSSL